MENILSPADISEKFNNYFVEIGQLIANTSNSIANNNFKKFKSLNHYKASL